MNRTVLGAVAAAVAVTLAAGDVVGAQEPPPPGPKFQPAWLHGRQVEIGVDTPGPDGPTGPADDRRDITIYLVGPIDEAAPQDAGGRFPLPPEAGGGEIVVPVHDTVLQRGVRERSPADCFGAYVLAGPRATPESVTTRTDANGSGLALVSRFRFGRLSLATNSAPAIKLGLMMGLLQLDDSIGYGGTCWVSRMGGGATSG